MNTNRNITEIIQFLEGRKKITVIELTEFLSLDPEEILALIRWGDFIVDQNGSTSRQLWKLPACQVRAWFLNQFTQRENQ